MQRLLPLSSAALGLLLFAGCAVGPDYRQPTLPVKLPVLPAQEAAVEAKTPWWQRSESPALAGFVERAFAGNRDLRAALARLDEAKALRRESRTAFLPVGTVSAGYRRQLDSTVFFTGVPRNFRDQDIFDVGIDSAWELDLFGRIRRTVEANTAMAGAAEAELAQLRLAIAAETARAYVELATVQAALPLQERQLADAREILRLLRCQVAEGKISRDRLGQAETSVATAQTDLRTLQLAGRAARNRLGVLIGEGLLPDTVVATLPTIPAPQMPGDSVALLTHRPDVQAAERHLAASTAAIGIARADYFPTVSFVARAGAEANKLDRLDTADANTFAFGPRLQWDLLNLQRTRARVQGAEARMQQTLAAWENTVLLALEEIDNALARRTEALAQAGDWQRAETAMRETARIAQLRREVGHIDPADALAAEQAAMQAQIARLRADAELANAGIFLHQSLALEQMTPTAPSSAAPHSGRSTR